LLIVLNFRWEEEKPSDGTKWSYLEHKGPVFAPLYEPLPDTVKFYYNNKQIRLSAPAEEIAGFYAKMLEHEFTTKKTFNDNFFKDWRKSMTSKEKELITDLSLCNFKPMCIYFQQKSEERKAMTKEEKLVCARLYVDFFVLNNLFTENKRRK
jgi:DNA topoisomerase I